MRGGYRPGAGGVKKSALEPGELLKDRRGKKKLPLEYMLAVMNDDEAAIERRDRMAIAAAPFCHKRAEAEEPGKRAEDAAKAKRAGIGRLATPPAPKLVVSNG